MIALPSDGGARLCRSTTGKVYLLIPSTSSYGQFVAVQDSAGGYRIERFHGQAHAGIVMILDRSRSLDAVEALPPGLAVVLPLPAS